MRWLNLRSKLGTSIQNPMQPGHIMKPVWVTTSIPRASHLTLNERSIRGMERAKRVRAAFPREDSKPLFLLFRPRSSSLDRCRLMHKRSCFPPVLMLSVLLGIPPLPDDATEEDVWSPMHPV
jgi:hypothetical protein